MNRKLGFCCCGWWGGVTEVMLSPLCGSRHWRTCPWSEKLLPCKSAVPCVCASSSVQSVWGQSVWEGSAGRWPVCCGALGGRSAWGRSVGARSVCGGDAGWGQACLSPVYLRRGRLQGKWCCAAGGLFCACCRRGGGGLRPQHLCVHGGAVFLCGMRERVWRGSGGQGRACTQQGQEEPAAQAREFAEGCKQKHGHTPVLKAE